MKHISIVCLFTILLCSCVTTPQKPQREESKIEHFYSDFMNRHTDIFINNVVNQKTNDIFIKEALDSLCKYDFITNYPFRLSGCTEYSKGKYAIHLSTDLQPYQFELKHNLYELYFDILALTEDEELVMHLQQQKYYYVYGEFIERIGASEFRKYVNSTPYSDSMGISKRSSSLIEMYMGIHKFNLDSLKITSYRGLEL